MSNMARADKFIAERHAKIEKTAEAFFFHCGKHKMDMMEAMMALAGCYATIISQQPTPEMQNQLADMFDGMINPNNPRIVPP